MRLVIVTWLDACSRRTDGRWSDTEDVKELAPLICKSVGWLISDEPTHITIAGHLGETNAGGDICIPRVCVTSITDLKDDGE